MIDDKLTFALLDHYEGQMSQLAINSINYQTAHAKITKESLRNIGRPQLSLSPMDVRLIVKNLHDKPITSLTISNCDIDNHSLPYIEELLRTNTRIRRVDLSGNSAITNKGLNQISAVLKEMHPDDPSTGCCVRFSNPMTFFKRSIFNIKVVGEPVNKKSQRLSELSPNNMELTNSGYYQDKQQLINSEEDDQDCKYTIEL